MIPSFLLPITLVVIVALLVPRSWITGPAAKHWAVQMLLLAVVYTIWRYLSWRFEATMPEPGTAFSELVFYWTLFAVEMLIWVDTAILFLMLSRPRDNSAEADEGERMLRATADENLPTVDVFIATYNEDLEVLEKTIIGAKALEWPASRLRICVLDDGQREWLKKYCARQGVDYFIRDNNEHAKAGNINAAIARTDGEYFMVLDADFVPQQNFLYRAIGLFEDPKVGIVQIPHSFYNADPMQANLRLRKVLPDDQRFFFGTIMSGRDGWNAAFCCGSNSITRRTAMEAIGNKLPTGSITEDMLLTLALMRKGFVTRYLNERLALGLAPESLSAMYVQRARWARGAMQILFLKDGPLGPGLKLHERVMFIPLHWLAQTLVVITTLLTPAICLWTNWSPLPGASIIDILQYQVPALLAVVIVLRLISPGGFFPITSMVHNFLQAPRILPTVLSTLIKPHGHAFKVTPKGRAAGGDTYDKIMITLPALVILATAGGIYINGDISTRILDGGAPIPLLTVWAAFSMVVLTIVQAVAISPSEPAKEDSFPVDAECRIWTDTNVCHEAYLERLSVSSARLRMNKSDLPEGTDWLRLDLPKIGSVAGFIARDWPDHMEVNLHLEDETQREDLVRLLFTEGRDNSAENVWAGYVLKGLLMRAIGWKRTLAVVRQEPSDPPKWLLESVAGSAQYLRHSS